MWIQTKPSFFESAINHNVINHPKASQKTNSIFTDAIFTGECVYIASGAT